MDADRSHLTSTDRRTRDIIVEVTTDAQGEISNIAFKHSSGKQGIDGYVAESIHEHWPKVASARVVAEVTYSQDKGFSEPKVISSTPVQ